MRIYIENNRDELENLEPKTGWGTFDDALELINKLIMASLRNPDKVWRGE